MLALASGCPTTGSGKRVEVARKAEAFEALEVSGSRSVFLRGGAPPSAKVVADDNIEPMIATTVTNGTMHVHSTGSYVTTTPIQVHLTTPSPSKIHASGSGEITAEAIEVPAFTVQKSGSGSTKLAGTAPKLTISASGSGEIDAGALAAEDVHVTLSGSGSVTVTATKSLHATISGSGSVRYKGSPQVHENVSGSGSVKPF